MAHPKSKISKQRKRKRRTHYKTGTPQLSTCPNTGEVHLYHRAYFVDGSMYYKGRMVIKAEEDVEE